MKRINILALLLMLSQMVAAQIIGDDRDNVHFGIKAGVNFTNVYDASGVDFSSENRNGFVGGGFISVPIGKYLGIQPEVLFSQKGANAKGTLDGEAYTFKRTTNNLDVPIFFQVKPIPHLAIVAGPQLSFLMSQKDAYSADGDRIIIEQQFKNQTLRKANVGIAGGIDVWILKILLSGRVGCDLQKNTTTSSAGTQAPSYKNFWGQVTLGLRF
ncbi:MAG: PorT family protein [Sphingobacteriales bacterium JAD_PAG50586_3]|nr:MAG: PorT family protein [Sphingobacteriales bacterium JAD_PAG50586_3]